MIKSEDRIKHTGDQELLSSKRYMTGRTLSQDTEY